MEGGAAVCAWNLSHPHGAEYSLAEKDEGALCAWEKVPRRLREGSYEKISRARAHSAPVMKRGQRTRAVL